ncbi:MAG TPA: hypothetical protein VLW53_18310, partial [Candidatus Eisenbacteria bacterium]|nr:hypothetical protein [Candidatus Eisenbacteria bacterium]
MPRRTVGGEFVFTGRIGTIYQASNAEYLSRTTPRRVLLLPTAVRSVLSGRLDGRPAAVAAGGERAPLRAGQLRITKTA